MKEHESWMQDLKQALEKLFEAKKTVIWEGDFLVILGPIARLRDLYEQEFQG